MSVRALVVLLSFLAFGTTIAGQTSPDVNFLVDGIHVVEGVDFDVDFVATGLTAPLEVTYSVLFPWADWSGTRTLTPEFPLGSVHRTTGDDDMYSLGIASEAKISYVHPVTGALIQKSIPITIAENDPYPTVSVLEARFVENHADSEVEIKLLLSHDTRVPINVQLSTNDITAAAGSDYTILDSTITTSYRWPSATIRIKADGIKEGREWFEILTSTAGGTERGTFAIIDQLPVFDPEENYVFVGDTASLTLAFDEPNPYPNVAATITSSAKDVAGPRLGEVEIAGNAVLADVVVEAIRPGDATITAEFPSSASLYGTATTLVHVYDGAITIGDSDRIRMSLGEEVFVPVRMTPPPPAGVDLPLLVDVPFALDTDAFVHLDATGAAMARVRADAAGEIVLTVLTPGRRYASSVIVEVIRPLELTAIRPDSGSAAGGTNVVITGEGFRAPCTVKFGDRYASAVTVVDDRTLRTVTPPNAAGRVGVSVACGELWTDAPSAFLYTPPRRSRSVRH